LDGFASQVQGLIEQCNIDKSQKFVGVAP